MKENCFVPVAFSIFLIIMKAFDKKIVSGNDFSENLRETFSGTIWTVFNCKNTI